MLRERPGVCGGGGGGMGELSLMLEGWPKMGTCTITTLHVFVSAPIPSGIGKLGCLFRTHSHMSLKSLITNYFEEVLLPLL